MLLLICNRELLFIGKRKDEDDMAKSTKTYEERIRALEKRNRKALKLQKAHCTAEGTGKAKESRGK